MIKKIKGIVMQNPVVLEHCSIFTVKQDNNVFLILSADRQAIKDGIFVAQGQEICILGTEINVKGVVITKEAQIRIKKDE